MNPKKEPLWSLRVEGTFIEEPFGIIQAGPLQDRFLQGTLMKEAFCIIEPSGYYKGQND